MERGNKEEDCVRIEDLSEKKTYLYTNKMIYAKIRGLCKTKGYAKNKRGFMRIEGFCEP